MWLLLAILVSIVFGQSFWHNYKPEPSGFHIRGWKTGPCASEQWTDYVVNITNITISPDKPRLPGPIFMHVTMDVNENLPLDEIEMDLELRKPKSRWNGEKGFEIIPCEGWNFVDRCDGFGSCRYCNVLKGCKETLIGAAKHVKERKIFMNTKDHNCIRNNNLCPPPKGKWTMTFSKEFSSKDLPKSIFSGLYSNEYMLDFKFYGGKKDLGCAHLWIDVCRYILKDKKQNCVKEPTPHTGFVRSITPNAADIRASLSN